MKNNVVVVSTLLLGLSTGCQKNDDRAPMEIALQNEPPLSFNLVNVPDDATDVDLTPTLSWESAKNPKGSNIIYDVYLGKETNPTVLYQSGIDGTTQEITEKLHLITPYYWKVIAKDSDKKTSQSAINKFTTRSLRIPETATVEENDFSVRRHHTVVAFKNKLWLFAGESGGIGSKNDIWESDDGINWVQGTSSDISPSRSGHATVVFNNEIWVLAGEYSEIGDSFPLEDAWHSSNGVDWEIAVLNESFSNRYFHTATVFDNKIWVIGGDGFGGSKNDVWYSSDGYDWTQASGSAAFSPRLGHDTVVFDNKLWVIGGRDNEGLYTNDVWHSVDGINWTETTTSSPFIARAHHTTTVFEGNIWLLGGIDQGGVRPDVWRSGDGIDWIETSIPSSVSLRYGHTSTIFENGLWVIAGRSDDSYLNDVWVLD